MHTSMDDVAGVEVQHAGADVRQQRGHTFDVRGAARLIVQDEPHGVQEGVQVALTQLLHVSSRHQHQGSGGACVPWQVMR